jgi:two-component system response regulator DesR
MRLSLEPDFEMVGEASSGEEALIRAASLRPDVVIIDFQLPGLDGITAMARLRIQLPRCALVALSIFDNPHSQMRARAAGAVAFVSKRESPDLLPTVIRWAAKQAAAPSPSAATDSSLQ